MGGRVDDPVMFWQPWAARMKPHIFDATLGPDNMRMQLTPTDHGAVMKVTFPGFNPQKHPKRICFKLPPPDKGAKAGRIDKSSEADMFIDMTSTRAIEVPPNFGLRLRAQVDTAKLTRLDKIPVHQRISKSATMHCFEFHHEETDVTVWIGTSLISSDLALQSINREINGRSFDDILLESKMVWRELMGRVDIVDPGPMSAEVFRRLTIFYTGLWRALSFPRRLDEISDKGKRIHYSAYDKAGGTYPGILVTDNGFWDTFRSVYPLLNLVYPTEAGEIIDGWVNAFKEGGWLPEWSSPSYRTCMVGTYADVVISDAIIKDLKGFDKTEAWKAIQKDSYEPGGKKGQGGKVNYPEYDRLGYIPSELADSVSGTLDFAYSDYAVSVAATALGRGTQAKQLQKRALKAREHLYDKQSGLMRPKGRGGFLSFASPTQWGSGYVEGSAWHHSFPAFDLPGLATLHGGRAELASRIGELVQTPGTFMPGSYKLIIHEMEEMRALAMGQYAHNNQPVHHIPFLLSGLDEKKTECMQAARQQRHQASGVCPRLQSEVLVHEVLTRAYGLEFYSGDEDNGEMGAWYVLASLGLFEPAPGTKHGYALGSPLFRHVNLYRMKREPGTDIASPSLSIISHGAGTSEVRHVTAVLLNGQDVSVAATNSRSGWTLSYEDLFATNQAGITLRFLTGSEQQTDSADTVLQSSHDSFALSASGDDDGVLARLQRQLQGQQGASSSDGLFASRPSGNSPQSNSQARSYEQQQERILQLENQLKQQVVIEHRRQSGDAELSAGLTSTVYVAFGILVFVNGVGWFLCAWHQRSPNRKRGTRVASGLPFPAASGARHGLPRQREPGQDV
jgi:predicted alpha-1,2-mannosidase